MDGQRVPDLEQMDEHQVRHFLAELFADLSAEAEFNVRHEDCVMEMPRRAHQGPGEDEAASGGLSRSPDHSATKGGRYRGPVGFLCTASENPL